MDVDAIRKQSESAYKQWAVQWREHAKIHSQYEMKSWDEFHNIGIGRAIVSAANGFSLELEMPTLLENRDQVDILCCDKSLGHLIKAGIKPTYCMVCDANVDYEKYLKPYENELQDTILLMNVCGNPKWTEKGNWKDRIFFVNMDVLGSEREFMDLSGCKNVMAAGTNVSNAMIVLLTQCDNEVGRKNFFGYDKILLVGYDYSWKPDGKYYAFNEDGDGKANYMRHVYTRNFAGDYCFTSQNLAFSAVWLSKYVETFKLPVIQCSKQSIFMTPHRGVLSEQMRYSFRQEDSGKVRSYVREMKEMQAQMDRAKRALRAISFDHHAAVIASVS